MRREARVCGQSGGRSGANACAAGQAVEGYTRAKEAGKGGAGGGNDDKNIATAVSDWASVQITGFLQRGKGDVARDDNGLGGDDEQQTTRIL